MKLLCDQMLGSLAKWLRILGFDTYYANAESSDLKLIKIAINEDRVVISRDKELIYRCKKQNLSVIEIKDIDLDLQLKKVLSKFKIDKNNILSLCSICNSRITLVDKKKVKGKVPEKVYENKEKFWYCKRCNKYYWAGSHYLKILDKIRSFQD